MSYCIHSNQHAFFIHPRPRITLILFFSSIIDKTKNGKFKICFKMESVIKVDCFLSGYRSRSIALKVLRYSGYTFYSTKI